MNRRNLLKTFAAGFVAGFAAVDFGQPKRYGSVDVRRWIALESQGITLPVIHQGNDITTRCHFADDTGDGHAVIWPRDERGRLIRDPVAKRPLAKTVYGIRMVAGDPIL